MIISIVTATYNRCELLQVLYRSLLAQEYTALEWIIVDDGGSDNTPAVVDAMQREAAFPIRYMHQKNGGKQEAINQGLDLVTGDLVCVVDDDDYFLPRVLSTVAKDYETIAANQEIAGLSYLTVDADNHVWGKSFPHDRMVSDHYQCRINQRVWGDKLEFTKAAILKSHAIRYPFVKRPGGFGGDTVFFLFIANHGKTLYINFPVLVKEYRCDGLSVNWRRKALENPSLTASYYAAHLDKRVRLLIRLRYMVAYAAILAYAPDVVSDAPVREPGNRLLYAMACLPGKLLAMRWKKYSRAGMPLSSQWLKH